MWYFSKYMKYLKINNDINALITYIVKEETPNDIKKTLLNMSNEYYDVYGIDLFIFE